MGALDGQGWRIAHPTERVTADGAIVRVGDRVWRAQPGMALHQSALRAIDIGYRWSVMWEGQAYASEAACVRAAIATRKRAITKARQEIRSATAFVKKLRDRLATLEKGSR
jgi:uncharacterized protein (DUF3084 family)